MLIGLSADEIFVSRIRSLKTASGIYGNPIEISIIRESQFRVLRSLNCRKWLVFVILQGFQASVWVFILVDCMVTFFCQILFSCSNIRQSLS